MKKATGKKGVEKKSSGGAGDGNVTIDLGEVVEKKLRAAGLRTEVGKSGGAKKGGYKAGTFGGYRPGMFGGYRPWYSRFGRPWLGQEAAPSRRYSLIPEAIKQVNTADVLTGLALGIVGNRALVRLTPALWTTNDQKLVHEGIAFLAGLVPMLFKRTATTLGVAVPGAVMLGGTLVDKLFTALFGPPAVTLKGGGMAAGGIRGGEATEARQRLAAIQQRINLAQQGQRGQGPVPRVVARPQYA